MTATAEPEPMGVRPFPSAFSLKVARSQTDLERVAKISSGLSAA